MSAWHTIRDTLHLMRSCLCYARGHHVPPLIVLETLWRCIRQEF